MRAHETADAPGSPFSLLMPVWGGDRADRLREALDSATRAQQRRPTELVLSIDGPLDASLEAVVSEVEKGLYGAAQVLRHPRHRGLAATLQDGLEAARYEIVARADADDLCRPERFALQIPRMGSAWPGEGLDLLGGTMQEFSDRVPAGQGPRRSRPLSHEEMARYLPHHSPVHHPTVVLRRSVALAVGGYRDLALLEDYWLWERMLLGGARMGNLAEVVVDYRVDEQLFARRGGWRLLASDVRFQRMMLEDGVIGLPLFLRNLGVRSAYRLAPGSLRRWGYRRFIESGS